MPSCSCRSKNCRTSREELQESSEYGQWPLHSGRPHPTNPTSPAASANEPDRKRGLNPADETLNDLNKQLQKTGGGRQTSQMAIRRRQM